MASAAVGNFVIDDYLPGYGNVARAQIRTAEQALALRRLIIVHMETPDDRQRVEELYGTFVAKGRATNTEVTDARRHIAAEASGRRSSMRRWPDFSKLDCRAYISK